MRISSDSKWRRAAAGLGLTVALVASVVRCAPAPTCVRISDCDDGMTCKSGHCIFDGPGERADNDAATGPVGTEADAARPEAQASAPMTDAAGDGGSDAGDEASEEDDGGEIDIPPPDLSDV